METLIKIDDTILDLILMDEVEILKDFLDDLNSMYNEAFGN